MAMTSIRPWLQWNFAKSRDKHEHMTRNTKGRKHKEPCSGIRCQMQLKASAAQPNTLPLALCSKSTTEAWQSTCSKRAKRWKMLAFCWWSAWWSWTQWFQPQYASVMTSDIHVRRAHSQSVLVFSYGWTCMDLAPLVTHQTWMAQFNMISETCKDLYCNTCFFLSLSLSPLSLPHSNFGTLT